MTGEHDAGPVARTDGREEIGLASALCLDGFAFDAMPGEECTHEVDQWAIWIPADGGEGNELFENRQRVHIDISMRVAAGRR